VAQPENCGFKVSALESLINIQAWEKTDVQKESQFSFARKESRIDSRKEEVERGVWGRKGDDIT
jgi:hypothetical protein